MARDGDSFGVRCSGIRDHIWITAPDKSPAEAMRLRTDREALIANWRRFKATPARGGEIIYTLGDVELNLLAISGVTGLRVRAYGLGGTTGVAPSERYYQVFLMGMDEPIVRSAGRDGVGPDAKLTAERDALVAAWAAVHHKGAA